MVPRPGTLPGLARTALLLDRAQGHGLTGALFTDHRSLAASRAGQAAIRHQGAAKARATAVGMEEFEVVHAGKRSPAPARRTGRRTGEHTVKAHAAPGHRAALGHGGARLDALRGAIGRWERSAPW
ncbi:hypothetical protein ACGFX8_33805 [Streptomyces sp. NPDC048362]|uniref:hypothetical protein n=1 Tax=Streptomyces sp. NPDC048362 TaxID=3365539 RepID=UPI0037219A58